MPGVGCRVKGKHAPPLPTASEHLRRMPNPPGRRANAIRSLGNAIRMPKMPPRVPKVVPRASKMSLRVPKRLSRASKMPSRVPKMPPRAPDRPPPVPKEDRDAPKPEGRGRRRGKKTQRPPKWTGVIESGARAPRQPSSSCGPRMNRPTREAPNFPRCACRSARRCARGAIHARGRVRHFPPRAGSTFNHTRNGHAR